MFALCLAEGYGGAADANSATRWSSRRNSSPICKKKCPPPPGSAQAPELFLPDDRPPRLNEAAKASIRKLAGYMDKPAFNLDEAAQEYDAALKAAGAEPEPRLLFGLVLLKAKRDPENPNKAAQHFEVVKSELPNQLLPHAALAWLRLENRRSFLGIPELVRMIEKIPKPAGRPSVRACDA